MSPKRKQTLRKKKLSTKKSKNSDDIAKAIIAKAVKVTDDEKKGKRKPEQRRRELFDMIEKLSEDSDADEALNVEYPPPSEPDDRDDEVPPSIVEIGIEEEKTPGSETEAQNYEILSSNEQQFHAVPVWEKEVKKDLVALFKATADLKKSVKEIQVMLRERNSCANPPSLYSSSDEEEKFSMLPPFKLKKFLQVQNMEIDVNSNSAYQKQLIKKLATFGGKNVKNCVINIFNGMFTNKLKTKMCWKGTDKKKAFEPFVGIRNVIRRAVKSRIRKCSLADIDAEIKLRFNQAQKDYDREKDKKKKSESQ